MTVISETTELAISLPSGEALPALLARSDRGSGPGVLVVHDASGQIAFYRDLAVRLAAAGYVALLPDLYFRQGKSSSRTPEQEMARLATLDKRQSVRDLLAAADWLKAQSAAGGPRVGVVGFSLGATLALDMTAERSDLAVAAFYAFPAGQVPPDDKSPPAPLDLTAKMTGQIIAFWGDQDEVVPMSDVERLAAALDLHHVAFSYTIYPGIGHSFVRASELEPGHVTSAAALDAWAKTLRFFGDPSDRSPMVGDRGAGNRPSGGGA